MLLRCHYDLYEEHNRQDENKVILTNFHDTCPYVSQDRYLPNTESPEYYSWWSNVLQEIYCPLVHRCRRMGKRLATYRYPFGVS